MRTLGCDARMTLGLCLALAACGGATSNDPRAAGSGGAAGGPGSGGSAGSAGGGGAGCTCAAPLVCDAGECVAPVQLVSATTEAKAGNAPSWGPDVSRDGHVVVFASKATDLAPDTQGDENVFSRYLPGASTTWISMTGPTGTSAKSNHPAISPSAEYASFASTFSFFVSDQNANYDVFVADLHSLALEPLSTTPEGKVLAGASIESGLNEDSGRMVFSSENGLVPLDQNGILDVYLVERGGGPDPVLLSTPSPGKFPSSGSFSPCISAHGRFVAFVSSTPDPGGADGDQSFDVFLKDLDDGSLERLTPGAGQASDYFVGFAPRVSAEGEVVVFASQRPLTSDDDNGKVDVYAWERATHQLTILSRSPSGAAADGDSMRPSISDDGRFAAFDSWASNLVPGDSNQTSDVFVVDLQTHEVALLSQSAAPGNGPSLDPRISGNGRFVAFDSEATNLVPADDNAAQDVFLAANPLAQ